MIFPEQLIFIPLNSLPDIVLHLNTWNRKCPFPNQGNRKELQPKTKEIIGKPELVKSMEIYYGLDSSKHHIIAFLGANGILSSSSEFSYIQVGNCVVYN